MKIGDVVRRTRQVQQEDIELFATMTGDRNPVHFDPDLVARSRFGGIVVQGGVTSGLLNALVAQDLPGEGSVFLAHRLELPGARPAGRRAHRGGRRPRSAI